jgi:pentatricopeptide repeat protein
MLQHAENASCTLSKSVLGRAVAAAFLLLVMACVTAPPVVAVVCCRWDLALKLLQQMQAESLRPSSACLTSAINACLQGELPYCISSSKC